jgi:lipopolysaccharide/colanic/teichoic acid biosynthesis glycosyltransferase
MVQPQTPRRPKRFAEPEITSPIAVWRSMLAASVNSIEQRRARRSYDPRLEMFGIIVLAPAFVVLTVVILLVLLAIFVAWLSVVGVLFAGTVIADQVGRWWRRTGFFGPLDHRALGYPGR